MKRATIAAMLLSLAMWLLPLHVASAIKQKNEVEAIFINYQQFHKEPINESLPAPAKPLPHKSGEPKQKKASNSIRTQLYSGRHYSAPKVAPDCEQHRAIVQKYFGDQTDTALFIAKPESGCIADKKSTKPNRDGSYDWCLFQINNEPATAKDLDLCVRRAYEKYAGGRVGSHNWSAWYAVCTPGDNPQAKYPGIKCQ